ncbi:Coenzyme F420 hydrogenase/dehydrogenase, beta subunit C-terminal domain [uncultured Phascolarctobacterium sp.]|uniref:Coenzyme F420 hydrogenase/dehydrogenase, beta subunit C-terminal domain n=1 Tax=uncultured Phascolarctobacterium sp. TaxID=512296 RepID=UPI0025D7E685|nr:Coenzyme F420 hydrogenase/dehydrogenase, beta subunit C-terminal domain [uncultured Phascolarctobacterium sp.]
MLDCLPINCTGCGACVYTCPRKAITMKKSSEGFLYPAVEQKLCVHCDLCNSICPALVKNEEAAEDSCYAVQLYDKQILRNVASGGAFYGIAKTVIEQGGIVFGVSNTGTCLEYKKVKTLAELQSLVGSKYYQCNLNSSIYKEIVDLSKSNTILVSGTPCMISAIKNLKGIKHENLLTFEILCQGVPSNLVIKKFYANKEAINNSKIVKHIFRSKDYFVGRDYLNRYEYENGKVEHLVGGEDPLCLSFQRQIFLRESCYRCKYANSSRVADFTAGDLWNYKLKEIDIKLGCSVLLCNTSRAKKFLESTTTFYLEEINKDKALKDNIPFHRAVSRPYCRNYSYKLLNRNISCKLITLICCYRYYIKNLVRGVDNR